MYNLSPRWKDKLSSTPDNLGPNNYFLESGCTLKNRAPFLSTTPRKSIGNIPYTEAIYNTAISSSIKGGTSLKYTSQRNTVTHWTTPGPGEYNPRLPRKKVQTIPTKEEVKGRHLYVCPVPYSLEATGPAIPTKIDENGYYIGSDGYLKKSPPNVHDTSLGPAYYNVETGLSTTEKLYRGCKWSKSQSRRWIPSKSDTPSAADYTINEEPYVNPYIAHMQEMARLYCPQPRFCDLLIKRIVSEDMPAANQYYIQPDTKQKSLSLVTVGFSSSKSRFLHKENDNPSPAKYDLRTGLCKRSVSTKHWGFNVQSKRLTQRKPQKIPGPADYEITDKSIKGDLIKEIKKITPSYPPFNRSMGRKADASEKENALKPSPNQYVAQKKCPEPQQCAGSTFRSTSSQRPQLKISKTTEPATYNVTSAFNKNKEQKSFNVMDISFQSTFPRTGTFKPKEGPGPAVYAQHKQGGNKGFLLPTTPRFHDIEETPGPAEHHIHPQYSLSIWKAIFTHNLRLKENAFHTKLRQSPTATKDAWGKERRKQRRLYAFYKPKPKRIASWIGLEQ